MHALPDTLFDLVACPDSLGLVENNDVLGRWPLLRV